jgi:hypothetical protein
VPVVELVLVVLVPVELVPVVELVLVVLVPVELVPVVELVLVVLVPAGRISFPSTSKAFLVTLISLL